MKSKIQFGLIILIVLALLLTACTTKTTESTVTDSGNNESAETVPDDATSGDCGEDIDCFIAAAKTCSSSTWTNQYGLLWEITGPVNDKCNVYFEWSGGNCPYEQERLVSILEGLKVGEWSNDMFDVCDQTGQVVTE